MTLSLDHVVIAVNSLDEVKKDYTSLGFTVLTGGEHPGRGSRNALVVFSDGAYLELIAFDRKVEDFRWWQVLDKAGPGFVDFALLPDNIDRVVREAQDKGLAIGAPEDGGRLRPDGARLEWKTARTAESDLPFLCGDVTPRALRVEEGAVRRHANQVKGISSIVVAVVDLKVSIPHYQALLGSPPGVVTPSEARFLCGAATIILRNPATEEIRQHLAARGEGPAALTFAAAAGSGQLDLKLTHGAPMYIGS